MKKEKTKSEDKGKKEKKKAIRKSIEGNLLERITESLSALGYDPDQLKDEIEQASRLIAKRIIKNIKLKKQERRDNLKTKRDPENAPTESVSALKGDLRNVEPAKGNEQESVNEANEAPELKRAVKDPNENKNIDPVTLAEQSALQKAKAGEPDLDEQLGSIS